MKPWPPITRDDLKNAATFAGFDTVFPFLVRRLIAETADGLLSIDMPGGSGIAAGGFDGVVTTRTATSFVPAGTSVWELSVGGGQRKAEHDYSIRVKAPDGLAMRNVTYVEALLVPWTKSRAWARDKNEEGRWREVRGYNLDRIHAWLDQAPATTVWLAEQLAMTMPGVRSLGDWWSTSWLPATRIALDEAFVLAGRDKAAIDLAAELATGRSLVTLGGDLRPDEACAFVAAALERDGSLDGSSAGARALVVSDATTLAQLVAQRQPMIILLNDAAIARDLPSDHPHSLIVNAAPGQLPNVDVPRLDRQIVEAQLESAGSTPDEATRLGTLSRRSLLALRRALAHHPSLLTPSWAATPDVVRRRLVLLGAWRTGNAEDRRIVAECVGQSYDKVEKQIERLSHTTDEPFMGLVEDIRHVTALEDTWTLLSPSFTADDLQAFRAALVEVLTELDPALDLPRGERWLAGIRGVKRRYSSTLRDGLAESLALLGAFETVIQGTAGSTSAAFARAVVRDLLAQANADKSYRMWLSLAEVLPLFAEAAPNEFLDAMRAGLSGASPAHAAMFTDNGNNNSVMGGSSPHTWFLWALERLAWSPEYIDDAVDVLAALVAIDPGGGLSNRSLASLVGVLCVWAPNTTATAADRVRCIERVARQQPSVGRRVLLALIPDWHSTQILHPGPRFRSWKRRQPVTAEEIGEEVDAVVGLLIEMLDSDLGLYLDLIDKIDDVPTEHRAAIAAKLRKLGQTLPDNPDRAELFEALRKKIANHREHGDAAWALPSDQIEVLQEACDALTPEDPVRRHAWLFRADWITLGDVKLRDDIAEYERDLLRRRASAIAEIIARGGLDALLQLGSETTKPYVVGVALAAHSDSHDKDMLALLTKGEQPGSELAAGYLSRRLREGYDALRDQLLDGTSDPLTQARILRFTGRPDESRMKLSELDPGVSAHYWREFVYYGLGPDFLHVLEVSRGLLAADRPVAALDLLMLYQNKIETPIDAAEIAASGLELLLKNEFKDPELGKLQLHHFEQLFALLAQHRDELGKQRVLTLEWQIFPIVGLDVDSPTLHRAIAEDPAFFADLVIHSYKPDDSQDPEGNEEPELSEQERARASRALEVLRTCRRCPGMMSADGQLELESVRLWINDARERLRVAGRPKVGDRQIGRLLAHSPSAKDGAPVHEVVRDLLEEIGSDEIVIGIEHGISGTRMTSRAVTEGGAQEWELAKRFHSYSEAARDRPRTRKLLRKVAESYEADARRQDAAAERRRQGLGW